MSYQELINILLGLLAFFGSFYVKSVSSEIKGCGEYIDDLYDKNKTLELLVANSYVKKDDLNKTLQEIIHKLNRLENLEVLMATEYSRKSDVAQLGKDIFKKLDRIEEKLDQKMDKEGS